MDPLNQGMWGPTVRISHMRDALGTLAELDLIAGYRGARRLALARYAFAGRLRGLDGVYVESSSFLPSETDLAFLGLARALRIPVLTYVRDAYQLFADYGAPGTPRQRVAAFAFRPMMRALRAVSTRMAFPSIGLARAVLGDPADAVLLPPAAPPPVEVPRRADANRLLFVGDARLPAQGADRLIAAVERAREIGAPVELTIVCRPGQEPSTQPAPWLRVVRAEGEGIVGLLPEVLASVIPRPRGAYNDLAVPVKLHDYLSYGRPLLVTDCVEQARVVSDADAGLVVSDDVDAIAAGIARLASASAAELDTWSQNAHAAARRSSWHERAERVVAVLGGAA